VSPEDPRDMVLALALAAALQASAATPGQGPGVSPPGPFAAVVDSIIEDGVRRGVYPGAVVVIGRGDTVLLAKGYGRFTWSAQSPGVDPAGTLFDLASLTKVVATTPAVMRLVEEGRLVLDSPVVRYLPAFGSERPDKARITVRQLLSHTSGLRAFLPLNTLTRTRDQAIARVLAEPPTVPPGTRMIYSDLNAILVGLIVERVSGEPLDRFVGREVFTPLGLAAVFNPPRALRDRIMPSGRWRGRPVAGEVHDQNAARMGGVAGHAGLFATGLDVARLAQVMLREGRLRDGRRLFRAETVRAFTARVPGAGPRALGWETVPTDEDVSSAGQLLTAGSFGHTGFTGTEVWIDPARDLFIVFFANRTYGPRVSRPVTALKEIRGRLADAAARASDACGGRC
jgi:beta-N-acetylhexosaminidase